MSPRHPRRILRTGDAGPFRTVTCSDGSAWVRGARRCDDFREWSLAATLTPERVRHLVRAIGAAAHRTALARPARTIEQRYVGDPCARDPPDWVAGRGRRFGGVAVAGSATHAAGGVGRDGHGGLGDLAACRRYSAN